MNVIGTRRRWLAVAAAGPLLTAADVGPRATTAPA
jgi:hypothetical protein